MPRARETNTSFQLGLSETAIPIGYPSMTGRNAHLGLGRDMVERGRSRDVTVRHEITGRIRTRVKPLALDAAKEELCATGTKMLGGMDRKKMRFATSCFFCCRTQYHGYRTHTKFIDTRATMRVAER